MKAIDVHAHISTREGTASMLKYQKGIMQYYMKMDVSDEQAMSLAKSDEQMAQDFIDADVKGILVGWDAEANTGHPRVSNDYLADVVKRFPQAFIGAFACVDPWKGQMALQEIEHCVRDLGMMGVKFQQAAQAFYPNDHRFYPMWDLCASLSAVVQFHTGTTGLGAGLPGGMGIHLKYTRAIPYIDDVAADFPQLQIICCHPSWPWQEDTIAVVLHKANVNMELSGWSPKYFTDSLKREIRGRLQDRAMFGSDYPLIPHQRLFQDYEHEGYAPEILEKIYYKNAQRILGITIP